MLPDAATTSGARIPRHASALAIALCLASSSCTKRNADWSRDLALHHRSRYFEVHYQRPSWDAARFARVADAFVDLVDRDFVPARFDRRLDVLVFPDPATFHRYLRETLRVDLTPMGIYLPALEVLATYEGSGLGTFTHEIMHHIVRRALPDCPPWAFEGIPAFFEKFFGYWDGDRLVIQWGYQNPWRLERLGAGLTRIDLARVVANGADSAAATSEQRLVAVFLWQRGRLERFLRLVAARDHRGFQSYLEAALERPLAELEPAWRAYLADIAANRAAALNIPASMVYPDRVSFENALGASPPWLQARAR